MPSYPHLSPRIAVALCATGICVLATGSAHAQYPERPIRMIVPLAAGGGGDFGARLFAQKLSEELNQQVVVDNRPGASGVIGADLAAKSVPDGYTILWVSSSHVVLPSLHKKLPYDTVKDFSAVSMLVTYPFVLVAHPSVAAKTVGELLAYAKANPGKLTYASSGSGSTAHLAAELLKSISGADITHVPYKGSGPAITGLLSGETGIGFFSAAGTLQHVKAGRLRALATTGEKRSPQAPTIPTVDEGGVKGYEASTWGGILLPAKASRPLVESLHATLMKITVQQDVKDRLAPLDATTVGNKPAEFQAIIEKEIVKWGKVVRSSGAKLD